MTPAQDPKPARDTPQARPPRPVTAASDFSGLLLIDKPTGVTSHDMVDRVRRVLRIRSAGHLGTLDPAASGLLVLALGAATRCAALWQGGAKTYEATIRFGVVTDSQDLSGAVLEAHASEAAALTEHDVRAASERFLGAQTQVPPMVSALKHRGERLYAIARRGDTVEREARAIHVYDWDWTAFALPEARATVRCSGGTYVRTLAHDLGAALGCGGALAGLRRTASLPFDVARACGLQALVELAPQDVIAAHAVPLDEALGVLPGVTLDHAGVEAIGRGQFAAVDAGAAPVGAGPRSVVLRDGAGRALALGELRAGEMPGRALACPQVVFPWAVREGRAA